MKNPDFYRQLGSQIAQRRKALGLTQTDLAQELGIAQQTMAHYEGGSARIAVATLPTLARVLRVPIEELIGVPTKRSAGKRGPQPKIAQQLQQIETLPKAKQRAISQVLDSVLAAHQ
ncbi:MAG TPA: helix-turn-helix transcriptional regulator [Rhodanobacteraceae bacterium]